ncbi:AAA family ATPase [Roseobacter sp. EG26]|uniref:AAA family ATPase n=1 Tax=Roseobacter sp. EG26 TaxID=3412477 RepID=UPI003CE58514
MILEGNERGSGAELARHLMNPIDNDHVTVHLVDGFVAEDLAGAFAETEAISEATQCRKYLFSLSLNPPPGENVPMETFEAAIARVEDKLGLTGQPRAMVFHEKNGRRHAHCVWSRIDARSMKAIQMSLYKRKLTELSRDLFLEHGWRLSDGFRDTKDRDPRNFRRAEGEQAKREQRDPKTMKAMFRACWEQSDGRAAFSAALKEQGFLLARGERRGFVGVDADGKIWSLSRWCGVKPKDLREKLGTEDRLPSVDEALAQRHDLRKPQKSRSDAAFEERRRRLVAGQRAERTALLQSQEQRRTAETLARQTRLPRGLAGVLSRLTGRYENLQRKLRQEAQACDTRDAVEKQALISQHLDARQALRRDVRRQDLTAAFGRKRCPDPRQKLILPKDDLPYTRDQLLRDPALILTHISHGKARFERSDIERALSKRIKDREELSIAVETALQSKQLVATLDGKAFTTQEYQYAATKLDRVASQMSQQTGFVVSDQYKARAISSQDAEMKRTFGGCLSDEQREALDHILRGPQLVSLVGLAGAGKSTMLATARDAWARQGVIVHGAALAGKAADGLEKASGIPSRTLASLETAWENGYAPIGKGDVLIVDEAGMIGTRQLARVAQKTHKIGAKLVLVGDPDQLQPIEAGTPFRKLLQTHGSACLTEIHRQREGWQKQASKDLAEGRTVHAVKTYVVHQSVTHAADHNETLEALVDRYVLNAEAEPERRRLAFAHRRKDVHALNQSIRAALRSEHPAQETLISTATGPRAFSEGDRIVLGKNDRALALKNGMLGTVDTISDTGITIALDDQRKITINPEIYRHLDHGYAVTIHKSQGATVDYAYVLASRSMDKHLAYVAMTRHRENMHVFVDDKDRPHWVARKVTQEHEITLQSPGPER